MSRRASTAGLLCVLAASACLPRSPGGGATSAESTVERSDSVAVLITNDNYLNATVRLFSGGAHVRRFSVGGLDQDTMYVRRGQLRASGDVSAVLELVGSRESQRLGPHLLSDDVTAIEIRVAELLSISSMVVY